jgi:hypothetical protein
VHDHLGVAARAKHIAQGLEFGHEFLEVVDLAVEHDAHAGVGVELRLLAGGQVDHRQAAVAQRQAGFEVQVVLVRAPVGLDVVDAGSQRAVVAAQALGVEEAGNAAHVSGPPAARR